MKRSAILALFACLIIAPSARSARKGGSHGLSYSVSFGLGAGKPRSDEFSSGFGTGFGAVLDVGLRMSIVEILADFDYGFYFNSTIEPLDANTLNTFLMLKVKPFDWAFSPYALAGGGYYRYWVVNADLYEGAAGAAAGGGVEAKIGEKQRLFVEGKYVVGRTRRANPSKANTESLVGRVGLTWIIE